MTQRSEVQHRVLELKATLMGWVANKLFSFRQTGLDGLVKRMVLKQGAAKPATAQAATDKAP